MCDSRMSIFLKSIEAAHSAEGQGFAGALWFAWLRPGAGPSRLSADARAGGRACRRANVDGRLNTCRLPFRAHPAPCSHQGDGAGPARPAGDRVQLAAADPGPVPPLRRGCVHWCCVGLFALWLSQWTRGPWRQWWQCPPLCHVSGGGSGGTKHYKPPRRWALSDILHEAMSCADGNGTITRDEFERVYREVFVDEPDWVSGATSVTRVFIMSTFSQIGWS